MEKKRSIGVTVTAIWFIILGITGFVFAILTPISSGYYGPTPLALDIVIRILIISFPIGLIGSAIGLLNLKKWAIKDAIFIATTLAIILSGFGISGFFYSTDSKEKHLFNQILSSSLLFSALLFIIAIYYLTNSKVKEQFK